MVLSCWLQPISLGYWCGPFSIINGKKGHRLPGKYSALGNLFKDWLLASHERDRLIPLATQVLSALVHFKEAC